jgi:hypothetical protein
LTRSIKNIVIDVRKQTVAYETFERKAVRIEDPALTLRPEGRISFNAAASRLLQTAAVKTVRILWDKTTCGLAVQAAPKGDSNSYSVAFSRSRSATVTAKLFFQHIGWSSAVRQTIPASWDGQRKMMEAKLPLRFVGSSVRPTSETAVTTQKPAKGSNPRSPGASGNIRNWMALNENIPKK